MIDLGALKIGVQVDRDGAEKDLTGLQGKVQSVQSKFDGFGQKLKTGAMIGGAAVVGAVGTMGALATKASETTDRIDKMSQKLGLSREGFQEWDYILSQNGASIDSMGAGMKTLTNQVDELSKGGKVATDAFGELGLSYDDLAGKSQEEIFEVTVKALQDMEDETKRAAIANDLLGRSGQELAPLLNAGADSVDALKKNAHDLGIVLEDDAIDAGVKFTDTMDNLKRAGGALFAQIGTELMPIFQNLADWIIAHMPQIREIAGKAFDVISTAVQWSWELFRDYLLPVFASIFEWTQKNWPTISAIIKAAFDTIKFVWDNVLGPVLGFLWDALAKVVDYVSDNFPAFQATVEGVMDGVGKAVDLVVGIFNGLAEGIDWALDKWNKWINRDEDEDKSYSGNYSGGASAYATKPMPHATGLDYVPYDGYLAELHKGERVLTAQEAKGGDVGTVAVVEAVNRLERTLQQKNMTATIARDAVGRASTDYINERIRTDGQSPIYI